MMTPTVTTRPGGTLAARYQAVRTGTEALAEPLSAEDQTVQSMPDVSPTKWHRAHTSWFFETFLLEGSTTPKRSGSAYRPFDPMFGYLFNSYYEQVGARYPRPERGLVSRPGVAEIAAYRGHVDAAMAELLGSGPGDLPVDVADLVELGLQHEQQHQELLLMDIKHVLSRNPMLPAYAPGGSAPDLVQAPAPCTVLRTVQQTPTGPHRDPAAPHRGPAVQTDTALGWTEHPGGLAEVGFDGAGFCFDNELPRHPAALVPFAISSRPVTCGDWQAFIDDGGYRRPELWLSEGWATVQSAGWQAPLYWTADDGGWQVFTLEGARSVDPGEPVCHVSYFEADAYARWAGARLPTEHEWEVVARAEATGDQGQSVAGSPVSDPIRDGWRAVVGALHPRPVGSHASMMGDVWQWTQSSYAPFPGFRAAPGAVGEYNGKFMVNQYVLRGGSCVTPAGHARVSYRNFFPASARWPFTGLRLAVDR